MERIREYSDFRKSIISLNDEDQEKRMAANRMLKQLHNDNKQQYSNYMEMLRCEYRSQGHKE